MKKVPVRQCIVSRERFNKNELVRVVRTPEGVVKVDLTGRLNGRGAYLKLDKDIIAKAQKKNVLGRHLEVVVPTEIYDELVKLCDQNG